MHRLLLPLLAAIGIAGLAAGPARADDIVADWSSVTMPPAPALHQVTVDPAHTALLVLDFDSGICNAQKRPRCFASLPKVASLVAAARAHKALVVYSTVLTGSLADEPQSLAAQPGDPVVKAGVDKFFGTDLADILRAHAIDTVIVTGTSAHGAALYTASAAALRGLKTVVPVDGMSADDPFAELAAAWIIANAPASITAHTVLTRSDMIQY
jgi:nicotinamidase-related amidase